jgi:antitoxin FitA
MSVNIQIRDVPDEVRDRIAAQAAESGQSMQSYLFTLLVQVAARPSRADWDALATLRARAPVGMADVLTVIREGRDEGPNAGEYPR